MTSTVSSNAAVIAAALTSSDLSNHRSLNVKSNSNRGTEAISAGRSGNTNGGVHTDTYGPNDDGAVDDDDYMRDDALADDGMPRGGPQGGPSRARARRASEGAHLAKSEGKRASGDLKCEQCGKGYKHSSCLAKHLWEHTPEWSYTSKLLISKHQQVQLLEAATVLVGMNQDTCGLPETAKTTDSDNSSASPVASASSELHDDYISSAETTPPPISEQPYFQEGLNHGMYKRHSGASSAFSRSYQSAPSSSFVTSSEHLSGTSYGQQRPSTSGAVPPSHLAVDDDTAGLAAAVDTLCSLGTPRSGPVHLPPDVPPVPPLPAQYASQIINKFSGSVSTPTQRDLGLPPYSAQRVSNERNIQRRGDQRAYSDDEDFDRTSITHNKSDDEEEGVFGRMEE
ncbi:MAG: hypothetical protein Q9214_005043 [Letrouitia sp. 1 TL-2023]